MLLSEILTYVRDRVGETDDATILAEIRNTWKRIWATIDTDSCLFEMEISTDGNRIVTLPPYVYQLKAVKRFSGTPVQLFTPRAYYQYNNYRQGILEWRSMRRTPLMRTITTGGQLRIRTKGANDNPFTVTVKGAGNLGVTEWEDVSFQPADTDFTTQAVFADVSAFSKSAITNSDVQLYDINNNLIAVIYADQTDTWCQVVRVVDSAHVPTSQDVFYYTVLYKAQAPAFTRLTDAVPDDWGLVLQEAVTADRFDTLQSKDDRERATKHESRSAKLSDAVKTHSDENREKRVHLTPSPYTTEFYGNL